MEGTALYKAHAESRLDNKEYAKQAQNSEEGRARVQELGKLINNKLRAYLHALDELVCASVFAFKKLHTLLNIICEYRVRNDCPSHISRQLLGGGWPDVGGGRTKRREDRCPSLVRTKVEDRAHAERQDVEGGARPSAAASACRARAPLEGECSYRLIEWASLVQCGSRNDDK